MVAYAHTVLFRGSERAKGYLLLLPETVLTKICIVSSDSELEELMLEMLDERRIVAVVVVLMVVC
jgi:hypothetical protein